MPRTLLVTGGCGFIGSNFVRYWLDSHPGDHIIVLDTLTYAGNPANLPESSARLRFVQGDICDSALLRGIFESPMDYVIHFAAESHVDRSICGPEAFIHTNVVGTLRLLEATREATTRGGRIHFHHVSTDEVYGSLASMDPAFQENTPYAPNSPYSASKAASDHLVRAFHHTYGLPTTTSNCSNNYGPRHFPEKLIPLMLVNALSGKPLPLYGDGLNIRDWLYVNDHCRAIELVLTRGKSGDTYNIGGGAELTNIDIAHTLCDLLLNLFAEDDSLCASYPACPASKGKSPRELITFVPDRPGHDRRYAVDFAKARMELGFLPEESFQSGLKKTVRWYLDNESWWKPILDGSYQRIR